MKPAYVAIAACTLALALPAAGTAQFRYRVKPLTYDVLLSHEMKSDEWQRGASHSQTDIHTTREKLDMRTSGWLYHPALMTFSLGLRPEFRQQRIERGFSSDYERHGTFLGFDIDAAILPYKPYTLELRASQDRNEYRNSLARDQITESSLYAGRLLLKEYRMPTNFTLESRDRTYRSYYTIRDQTDRANVTSRHRTETSQTWLEAELQDRSRGVSGNELDSERLMLYASNVYRPSMVTTLNSNLRYTEDTWGDEGQRQRTLLNSSLMMRHHDKLRTDYHLRLEDRTERDRDYRAGRAMASLQHQLYENLTTTLNGDASKSESTSGDLDQYGAGINLAYARRIPWGQLNARIGHTERVRDWRRLLTEEQISDEAHVLTWEEPWVELTWLDIEVDTIEVYNDDRSIRYTRDIEYRVEQIGRVVQIHWIDEIFPGDTIRILVDYRHETDPSAKTHESGDSFAVGVSLWSTLTLQYSWSQRRVDLLSGTPGAEDTRDRATQSLRASLRLGRNGFRSTTTASVEERTIDGDGWEGGRGKARGDAQALRQAFRIGNWSTTTFEIVDKSVSGDRDAFSWSPTRTQRARQGFTFRPTRRLSVGLSAHYSEVDYKDTGHRTEGSGYAADLRWRFGRGKSLDARAYRRDMLSRYDDTESTGVEVNYRWRYGLWYPGVRYTLAEEDRRPLDETRSGTRRTKQVLYFEVRREFR